MDEVESDNFHERFGAGAIISIRYTTVEPGFFAEHDKYGGLVFDPSRDLKEQAKEIADILCKRIIEDKQSAREAEAKESVDIAAQEPILPALDSPRK